MPRLIKDNLNKPKVEIEECSSVLIPAPGVSIEEALEQACLSGYKNIRVENNTAHIVWFKK